MKKAKPHINNLSTSRKVKVGDMVCYDLWSPDLFDADPNGDATEPEHGLVVEISTGSIVKVRPLNDWNKIRLLNVADCRVLKAQKDGEV
jgi:hypothetical protein